MRGNQQQETGSRQALIYTVPGRELEGGVISKGMDRDPSNCEEVIYEKKRERDRYGRTLRDTRMNMGGGQRGHHQHM